MSKTNRAKVELRRKRENDETRARITQAAQVAAEVRRSWERRRQRKILAWMLMGLAPVVFVTHFFEHAGAFQVFSPGFEDLTIGFPTALLLLVAGAVVYGRD